MDLEELRREYCSDGLGRDDLDDDPFVQFECWLKQAIEADIQDPTAMSVATIGANNRPWQRIVLLKHSGPDGFIFYTNLGSRKAEEIALNAHVCLLFPWLQLNRQIIIGGRAERLPTRQVLKYFLSRPRESQLAAWSSAQSRPLSSRVVLEQKFAQIKHKFQHGEVPVPDFWGGYRIVPETLEFWQGRPNRLHDRFMYQLQDQGHWSIERLAP